MTPLLIAGLFMLGSCGEDPETASPGRFTLEDEEYKLNRAYVSLDDSFVVDEDTYYIWTITLVSKGITYNTTDLKFEGSGNKLGLVFRAINDDSILPPGTYSSVNGDADSFDDCLSFDEETLEGTCFEEFDSVDVIIKKNNNNTYEITFAITLGGASTIEGIYKGPTTVI